MISFVGAADAAARYGALQRCTTACLCVNFSAILWQLAMQRSESSTAAHLVRKILTRLGAVECAAAMRKFRRDFYSAILYAGARSDESHDFIR